MVIKCEHMRESKSKFAKRRYVSKWKCAVQKRLPELIVCTSNVWMGIALSVPDRIDNRQLRVKASSETKAMSVVPQTP